MEAQVLRRGDSLTSVTKSILMLKWNLNNSMMIRFYKHASTALIFCTGAVVMQITSQQRAIKPLLIIWIKFNPNMDG